MSLNWKLGDKDNDCMSVSLLQMGNGTNGSLTTHTSRSKHTIGIYKSSM